MEELVIAIEKANVWGMTGTYSEVPRCYDCPNRSLRITLNGRSKSIGISGAVCANLLSDRGGSPYALCVLLSKIASITGLQ